MHLQGEAIDNYTINEYLIVLNPHEDLRNRIMDVKKEFANAYQKPDAVYSKPHIILANFLQLEMMEPRLINRLNAIAMGYNEIKIDLKNYGSLPTHTIYINITSKVEIQNLVKYIRQQAQQLMKLNTQNKPHFIMEPHLTIARKLLPWQYEKAWLQYEQKNFRATFIATEMLLLKRVLNTLKYTTAAHFKFMNLPVQTKQGELF